MPPTSQVNTSLHSMFMSKAAFNSLPQDVARLYCPHSTDRRCSCSGSSIRITTGERKAMDGKRSAETQTQTTPTLQKKPRHSDVVRNTVLTMMDSWFVEENDILSESNEELIEAFEKQAEMQADLRQELERKDRTIQLLQLQLEASRRYSHMVEIWCPQVREMFPGDLSDMLAIQAEQWRVHMMDTEEEDIEV